jgi:hypothetical protein
MTTAQQAYPVQVTGRLDDRLSRWLWLVKWVLVLPHVLVLALLWVGFVVLTAAAFVSILFTGRYPRVLFDYNVGVLRWTWRVGYYAYGALGTDQYPPFTLADRPDYPARFDVIYPEHLSRGLALVKWWLLALPHYLVVGLFLGGSAYAASQERTDGIGLVGLLALFAGVVLLVRGQYPRSIFDLLLGLNRWVLRVAAYSALMTDRYPPFRLDLGGAEPGTMVVEPQQPQPPQGPQPPRPSGWTGPRIAGTTLGAFAVLVGLTTAVAGTGLLVLDTSARDDAGYLMTEWTSLSTPTAALVEDDLELPVEGPAWISGTELLGTVRLEVTSLGDTPVFVGIAPRRDVARLLGGTAYDELSDPGLQPAYERVEGREQGPDPTSVAWAAAQSGTDVELVWPSAEGEWAVVAMSPDGSPGVAVDVRAGATVPRLDDVALTMLVAGLVVLGLGATAAALSVRAASRPTVGAGS